MPYLDGVNGCNACCPQFTPGSLTTLHLPPESGDIYDLQFTVDGSYVWRLVTTLQEWTPTRRSVGDVEGQARLLAHLSHVDPREQPEVGAVHLDAAVHLQRRRLVGNA